MRFLLIFLGIITLIAFLEPLFEDVKNSATLFGSLAGTVTLAVGIAWSNINEKARLILAVLILAGRQLYKDKKKGRSLCGGKCSCCPHGCNCREKIK